MWGTFSFASSGIVLIVRERCLAAFALGLAACFAPSAPLGVPCADNGDCPTGQKCDPVDNICQLPTELRELRDDTAADFAAEGAYLDEVTVESQGFIGPAAYFTGGVRMAGISGTKIADVDATPYEEIAANPLTGTSLVRSVAFDFGTSPPRGVGLPDESDITVIVEGEIELDATGRWGFELNANDLGFFEIAPFGTSDFQRIVTDVGTNGSEGTFQVDTVGWYRFRGAFENEGGAVSWELRYDPPNVAGNFRDVEPERLRARVGDLPGLLVDGFENPQMLIPRGSTISTAALTGMDLGSDPFGLPVGTSSYTLRWSGQMLIETEGDYVFQIDSRDGHRMWIDGQLVADVLVNGTQSTTTPAMRLLPGWHDVVVDMQRNNSTEGTITLVVAQGPELVGQFFPPERLRPVVGRIGRWFGAADTGVLAIPDGASATQFVAVDLPPDFVPFTIHVGASVDHVALPQVSIVVDPPAGGNVTLAAAGSISGTGTATRTSVLAGTSSGIGWNVIAADNLVDAVVGSITLAAVTLLGTSGSPPFERRFRYESRVHELGAIAAYDVMMWGMRQATDTETATAQVRTCDDLAACAGEPWTDVPFGSVPEVAKRRFLQYAIDVTTNGEVPTAVDFVQLGYTVFVPQ
jgi:hypothetical protein